MCCLPFCCPPGGGVQPRQFAAQALGATDAEAQGLDDICKALINAMGCSQRIERGERTVMSFVYDNTLRAFKDTFPEASEEECLARHIRGILEAVGASFAHCNPNDPNGQAKFLQALCTNGAPHIAGLLGCIFGAERGAQMEANFHRAVWQDSVNFGMGLWNQAMWGPHHQQGWNNAYAAQAAPQAVPIGTILMIIQFILPLICSGMGGGRPPAGGICPPPGGGGPGGGICPRPPEPPPGPPPMPPGPGGGLCPPPGPGPGPGSWQPTDNRRC